MILFQCIHTKYLKLLIESNINSQTPDARKRIYTFYHSADYVRFYHV